MSFGNPKVSLEIKPKIIGTEGIPFTRKLELFASSQALSLSERSLLNISEIQKTFSHLSFRIHQLAAAKSHISLKILAHTLLPFLSYVNTCYDGAMVTCYSTQSAGHGFNPHSRHRMAKLAETYKSCFKFDVNYVFPLTTTQLTFDLVTRASLAVDGIRDRS